MASKFCKHYRGMYARDRCEADVVFADLPNYGTGSFGDSCPCFGVENAANCAKGEYPTAEEIAAEEKEIRERFAKIAKARAAIVEHCGWPWKRGMSESSGVINCPVCGGIDTLHFVRSGLNGHMNAVCKSEDCVAWME